MSDSKNIHEATDSNFESDVIQAKELTLVDFWAEWCGPCRQLGPTIESIADEFVGKIKVMKMNVDQNQNTPTRFHIRGIPTVILFRGGEVVDQLVGNQPRDVITQTLQKHLTNPSA